MLAASMAPPPPSPPAPTRVWISSIIKMMFPSSLISLMMFLRRSSNSPRYFVPESNMPKSNSMIFLSKSISGTSPSTMRRAKPSAIAVLPTPGSPMSTGLFFCLLARIWIARSISSLRPTRGSISPAAAAAVRSLPNSSRAEPCCSLLRPPVASSLPSSDADTSKTSRSAFLISVGTCSGSTFKRSKIVLTFPSFSCKRDSKMWAGSTTFMFSALASLMLPAR
mmetsp:Transcript_56361/g.142561  ORF Transcript_56361/g.142561 Transcript_56361/m.142561 type:complete len:223 (+) Transcript_56361:1829-2497(+)